MRGFATVVALGLTVTVAAPAGAMSVADFRAKAAALQAKGPLALFSSDLKLLRGEITDAGKAWRAQAATARPPACPPPKAATDQAEVMRIMDAVPAAEQRTTGVRDAMIRALNAKYRCR